MPTLEPRAPLDPIGSCVGSQHSLKEGGDFGPEGEDGGAELRGRGRPAWMRGPVGRRCSAEGTSAPRECTPHWGPGTLPDLQVAATPGGSARPPSSPLPLPSSRTASPASKSTRVPGRRGPGATAGAQSGSAAPPPSRRRLAGGGTCAPGGGPALRGGRGPERAVLRRAGWAESEARERGARRQRRCRWTRAGVRARRAARRGCERQGAAAPPRPENANAGDLSRRRAGRRRPRAPRGSSRPGCGGRRRRGSARRTPGGAGGQ